MADLGLAAAMGRPRNLPAPYVKKNSNTTHQCVRRPESGTWQSVAMETQQQWEAVQGPMIETLGPGSSMRRRYRDP
ncbi:unnamed protein product [Staurois parvus]|uniref:Uncharacterized protein n=1 Tax=Staurois parvus TaxID=386267 RepID=A0ABN9E5N4_9NEOB|nr:unnamed protein product [Staurois parvus]